MEMWNAPGIKAAMPAKQSTVKWNKPMSLRILPSLNNALAIMSQKTFETSPVCFLNLVNDKSQPHHTGRNLCKNHHTLTWNSFFLRQIQSFPHAVVEQSVFVVFPKIGEMTHKIDSVSL